MNILLPEATTRNRSKHGKVREKRSHLVVYIFRVQFDAQPDILHSKNKGNIPYALIYSVHVDNTQALNFRWN